MAQIFIDRLASQIDQSAHYCVNHGHLTCYDSDQPQALKGEDLAIKP